jgi:type IV pilus assembly protein PilA
VHNGGTTTKYLKTGVQVTMPTKLKGMTSLEIAIIVAIVLVIAIAVGWYLYTTFAAAGQQSGLVVTSAVINKPSGGGSACLLLKVTPQGAASVEITSVEVAGSTFKGNDLNATRVTGPVTVKVTLTGLNVAVGQVLTGRVVLSSGAMAPFTATVVGGDCPS